MLGDMRWGGLYGVDVDFVALENCKLLSISEEAIQARAPRTGHGASSSSSLSNGFRRLCTPSTVCISLYQQPQFVGLLRDCVAADAAAASLLSD